MIIIAGTDTSIEAIMNRYEEAGNQLLKRYGITVKAVRKTMSGIAYIDDRAISAPAPKRAESFAVLAHEVGHIANGRISPRWLEELRAWEFSLNCFREFGLKVTTKVRQHMTYSMTFALAKALNRGMKKIPPELRKYKRYLMPVTYVYGSYGSRYTEEKVHADYRKIYHKERN